MLVGLNKVDIVKRDSLNKEKAALLNKLEEESIPIFEISTVTQEGITDFKNKVALFPYLFERVASSTLQGTVPALTLQVLRWPV